MTTAPTTVPELMLGDIVLAARGVRRRGRATRASRSSDHAAHLIVHGTLHLLGYDHGDDADAADMEAREVRALARLGIADPYEARALMASRNGRGRRRRACGAGSSTLIFGDEAEPTLRDQIEEAIEEAEDQRPVAGDLTPTERQMLRNLLDFGDHTAGDICVTRGDIIAVPATISFEELVAAFADAGHSRLPVYGESLDEVVGMIHIKDVFMAKVDAEPRPLARRA